MFGLLPTKPTTTTPLSQEFEGVEEDDDDEVEAVAAAAAED